MPDTAPRRMTVQEFLVWDDGTDRRYELIDGVPVAMTPPKGAHQVLAGTLTGHLFLVLQGRPPCTVRVEGGVRSRLHTHTWLQPDIAISCTPVVPDQPEVLDPILIVEILSPSTEAHDRRRKLPEYRALPTVQEILLVAQDAHYCEVHRRLDAGRWLTDLVQGPDAVLRLDSVGLTLPLSALYANIPIAAEPGEG